MRKTFHVRGVTLVVTLVLLNACANEARTPQTTPFPTQSASPSPSPSPAPDPEPLTLDGESLGALRFGGDAEFAIETFKRLLGPPAVDTGWRSPLCFVQEGRILVWGSLATFFRREEGREFFAGYQYGGELPITTVEGNVEELLADVRLAGPPKLDTPEGIGIGSTDRQLRTAYPNAEYIPPDPDVYRIRPYYMLGDFRSGYPMFIELNTEGPSGKVTQVSAGSTLDCGGE